MLVSIVFFIIAAVAAVVLFVAALVIWLAELLDSGALAAIIVGAAFALTAWIIYSVSVRQSIRYINDRMETVYEVAYAVRNWYKLVIRFLRSLLLALVK